MEYILKGTGTENQERYCLPNRGADEPSEHHQQLHQRISPDFRYSAGQEQLSRRYPLLFGQRAHGHRIGTCACLPWRDEDIIMEDYRLSNDYFNIPAAS